MQYNLSIFLKFYSFPMYFNFSTPVPTVLVLFCTSYFFLLGIIFMTFVFSQLMWYYFTSLHLNAGTELDSPVSEFRSRQAWRKQKSLLVVRPFPV